MVGLFWASDVSDYSRKLPTFTLRCFTPCVSKKYFYLFDTIQYVADVQSRAKAAPNPPVGGGVAKMGAPLFAFKLQLGIVDQC